MMFAFTVLTALEPSEAGFRCPGPTNDGPDEMTPI